MYKQIFVKRIINQESNECLLHFDTITADQNSMQHCFCQDHDCKNIYLFLIQISLRPSHLSYQSYQLITTTIISHCSLNSSLCIKHITKLPLTSGYIYFSVMEFTMFSYIMHIFLFTLQTINSFKKEHPELRINYIYTGPSELNSKKKTHMLLYVFTEKK